MQERKLKNNLDLIPLSKWNDHFEYPTTAALRQLVFYNTNDFANKVIRKIGKRIYIKVSAFFEWVENPTGGKNETL